MLVSIITITQNSLSGLQETYQSVTTQSFRDFEWVVIDGASTDGTPEWLRGHTGNNHHWISEPDSSLYEAMNKGIIRAQGEYVLFLNSGDRLATEGVLASLARNVQASEVPPTFIYGDAYDCDYEGNLHYRVARDPAFLSLGMFARHQAMLFQNACLHSLRYAEEYEYSADYALVCDFLHHHGGAKQILKISLPVCIFQLGGLHETQRLAALKQDYLIRRRKLRMSRLRAAVYTFLNFLAHIAKKSMFFRKNIIYKNRE